MAAPKPEFTDSFVVQTDNYGDFIRIVRQDVIRGYCSNVKNIVQPVLPPEQEPPKLWFHVLLHTQTSSLTLAIRMDNLYLIGFKTQAGVWWEFENDKQPGKHRIKDAEWLGFKGNYSDLIGHQKGLETVELGRAQLTIAVDILATHDAARQHGVTKSMLLKLVIMLCEGTRFLTVAGTVDKEFGNDTPAKITKEEGLQVKEWDNISKAVFKWADDPSWNPCAQYPDMVKAGVKNKDDAARKVALVKCDQK